MSGVVVMGQDMQGPVGYEKHLNSEDGGRHRILSRGM